MENEERNTTTNHRLIKSNILFIDGTDLRFCRLLELSSETLDIPKCPNITTITALTHTDARNDMYSHLLREIIFKLFVIPNSNRSEAVPIDDTYWFTVKTLFKFQTDNLYNSFEDVAVVLLNMVIREISTTSDFNSKICINNEILFAILEEYHNKLFENYQKWCDFMQLEPFPWGNIQSPNLCWKKHINHIGISADVAKLMIWGEASNLRLTPELLCYLFHWCIIATRENPRQPINTGSFLCNISVVVQRIKDEQWYGEKLLKAPDHPERLNYDDINEMFCESRSIKWLDEKVAEKKSQLSPTSLTELINFLSKSNQPGSSVKTFSEKQSSKMIYKSWVLSILSAVFLSGTIPLLDFLLIDINQFKKFQTWKYWVLDHFTNILRLGFVVLACVILIIDGRNSKQFLWNKPFCLSYFGFHITQGFWPLLHTRFFGRMPFLEALWKIRPLRKLLGPRQFVSASAFLAEDVIHIIVYILFWIIPIISKLCYWFFLILPASKTGSSFLNNVITSPLYFYDLPIFQDSQNHCAKTLFWIPLYLVWFFDTQIHFLLSGVLWSTISSYFLRIGYLKDFKTIQTQLIPLIPAGVLFVPDLGTMAETTLSKHLSNKVENPHLTKLNKHDNDRKPLVKKIPSFGYRTPQRNLSNGFFTPGSSNRTKPRVTYQNESDPFGRLFKEMNLGRTDNQIMTASGPLAFGIRIRKSFGFLWNEILHSWRMEDVISNEELDKLQFNEFPLLISLTGNIKNIKVDNNNNDNNKSNYNDNNSFINFSDVIGLKSWSELRTQTIIPAWEKSVCRLPVYAYCDLIISFLKVCENYQVQIIDPTSRIRSRKSTAKIFFKKYLSTDLKDQMTGSLHSALTLEGLREIVEAFFIYLSRNFIGGAVLVNKLSSLWFWIKEEPSRLLKFDLLALKQLHQCFIELFTNAQDSRDPMHTESGRKTITDLHERLKKALCHLIFIELENDRPDLKKLDPEIKAYLSALDACFKSLVINTPAAEFASVSGSEVCDLSLRIRQCNLTNASPLTDTLGFFGAGEVFRAYAAPIIDGTSPTPTLSEETIMNVRKLYKIETGCCLCLDLTSALKLYYRRAKRLLTVSEARLRSPEAERRFKFFMNSLLMKIPVPPPISEMVSMTTLTPYYRETCQADLNDIHTITAEGGIATMELLRSLQPEEFKNFLERVDPDKYLIVCHKEVEKIVQVENKNFAEALIQIYESLQSKRKLFHYVRFCKLLQEWASNRSQVLSRTVRGMMYYERGLQISNYLETHSYSQVQLGHDLNRLSFDLQSKYFTSDAALWANIISPQPRYLLSPSVKSLSRLKYTYVVAAQNFGKDREIAAMANLSNPTTEVRGALARRNGIIDLLRTYQNLRVATLEDELDLQGKPTGRQLSVLYRWNPRLQKAWQESSEKYSKKEEVINNKEIETNKPFFKKSTDMKSNDSNLSFSEDESVMNNETKKQYNISKNKFRTTEIHMSSIPLSPTELNHLNLENYEETILSLPNICDVKSINNQNNFESDETLNKTNKSSVEVRQRYITSPSVRFNIKKNEAVTPGKLEECITPIITSNEVYSEFGNINCSLKQRKTLRGTIASLSPQRFGRLLEEKIIGEDIYSIEKTNHKKNYDSSTLIVNNNSCRIRQVQEEIEFSASFPNINESSHQERFLLSGELIAVYKVMLPSIKDSQGKPWRQNPIIGHGKPENQNHAIIYTRGETIQAIDMNMDGYLEESLKLRNLLQEFTAHPRMRILGFREHIFSHDVSSLSCFMALQESLFVTNMQRLFASPLRVRMHYGHPDIFDRFFVQCCGGMSKASNGINVSEDVFAGYNVAQRGFSVGKGRDVGLQQIFMFDNKIAGGNAEQMISRDVRRLCDGMDCFRLFSYFYAGPGFFFNTLILVLSIFVFLYVKVFLSIMKTTSDASSNQYWTYVIAPINTLELQLGMFLLIPIILLVAIEKGLMSAFQELFNMLLKFGTKAAAIDSVLLYGGAKYSETGRGFQISYVPLAHLWKYYSNSHFIPAIEMLLLLSLYCAFSGFDLVVYIIDTWPLWLMYFSYTLTPFLFNPLGIFYQTSLKSLIDFNSWMFAEDLKTDDCSWRAWWRTVLDSQAEVGWHSKGILLIRLFRFIFLSIALFAAIGKHTRGCDLDVFAYFLSISIILVILVIFMREFQLVNPRFKNFLGFSLIILTVGILSWVVLAGIIKFGMLKFCIIGILILYYGLVQIILVLTNRWGARNYLLDRAMMFYHLMFAHIIFCPILLLASITFSFHKIQTRLLFNSRFVENINTGIFQKALEAKQG